MSAGFSVRMSAIAVPAGYAISRYLFRGRDDFRLSVLDEARNEVFGEDLFTDMSFPDTTSEGYAVDVAYDGVGLGTDGAAWGGEILVADYTRKGYVDGRSVRLLQLYFLDAQAHAEVEASGWRDYLARRQSPLSV